MQPPTIIDTYIISGPLKYKANTFKAMDRKTGTSVAITLFEQDKSLQNYFLQLEKTKEYKHEHIQKIYNVLLNYPNYNYVIQEFMENPSVSGLAGILRESPIRKYIRALLRALWYIHQQGFYHGNLSLSVVYTTKTSDVKLDFVDTIMQPNIYLSPEQANGDSITTKTDIFQVGLLTYKLITGEDLCDYKNKADKCFNSYDVVAIKKLEMKHAKEFIELCLTKEIQQRPCAFDLIKHKFLMEPVTAKLNDVDVDLPQSDDDTKQSSNSTFQRRQITKFKIKEVSVQPRLPKPANGRDGLVVDDDDTCIGGQIGNTSKLFIQNVRNVSNNLFNSPLGAPKTMISPKQVQMLSTKEITMRKVEQERSKNASQLKLVISTNKKQVDPANVTDQTIRIGSRTSQLQLIQEKMQGTDNLGDKDDDDDIITMSKSTQPKPMVARGQGGTLGGKQIVDDAFIDSSDDNVPQKPVELKIQNKQVKVSQNKAGSFSDSEDNKKTEEQKPLQIQQNLKKVAPTRDDPFSDSESTDEVKQDTLKTSNKKSQLQIQACTMVQEKVPLDFNNSESSPTKDTLQKRNETQNYDASAPGRIRLDALLNDSKIKKPSLQIRIKKPAKQLSQAQKLCDPTSTSIAYDDTEQNIGQVIKKAEAQQVILFSKKKEVQMTGGKKVDEAFSSSDDDFEKKVPEPVRGLTTQSILQQDRQQIPLQLQSKFIYNQQKPKIVNKPISSMSSNYVFDDDDQFVSTTTINFTSVSPHDSNLLSLKMASYTQSLAQAQDALDFSNSDDDQMTDQKIKNEFNMCLQMFNNDDSSDVGLELLLDLLSEKQNQTVFFQYFSNVLIIRSLMQINFKEKFPEFMQLFQLISSNNYNSDFLLKMLTFGFQQHVIKIVLWAINSSDNIQQGILIDILQFVYFYLQWFKVLSVNQAQQSKFTDIRENLLTMFLINDGFLLFMSFFLVLSPPTTVRNENSITQYLNKYQDSRNTLLLSLNQMFDMLQQVFYKQYNKQECCKLLLIAFNTITKQYEQVPFIGLYLMAFLNYYNNREQNSHTKPMIQLLIKNYLQLISDLFQYSIFDMASIYNRDFHSQLNKLIQKDVNPEICFKIIEQVMNQKTTDHGQAKDQHTDLLFEFYKNTFDLALQSNKNYVSVAVKLYGQFIQTEKTRKSLTLADFKILLQVQLHPEYKKLKIFHLKAIIEVMLSGIQFRNEDYIELLLLTMKDIAVSNACLHLDLNIISKISLKRNLDQLIDGANIQIQKDFEQIFSYFDKKEWHFRKDCIDNLRSILKQSNYFFSSCYNHSMFKQIYQIIKELHNAGENSSLLIALELLVLAPNEQFNTVAQNFKSMLNLIVRKNISNKKIVDFIREIKSKVEEKPIIDF